MIRIDEIYNNTFWPWIQTNLPLTRLFFMDPFGSTDPNDLKNFGDDVVEHNYIFMHDQEPIDLALHKDLFDDVARRNKDLNNGGGPVKSAIIVSETASDNLDEVCEAYRWQPFYYFFHGWASLDWYRGYDKTFLIESPAQRKIRYSFISPNRIVGGQRDHRLLLLYHLAKNKINRAQISFPMICPQENQPVVEIARKFQNRYPDIEHVISSLDLPWHFEGETTHPMTSCWLDLFAPTSSTLAYVVTETVYFRRRSHLTEKTFKPICLGMPFVIVSARGSLRYLREYGFKTFHEFWDESYDDEPDDFVRLEKIARLLASLDAMSADQLQDLYQSMLPIIEHNFDHFYNGKFERVLWTEFENMLIQIKKYLHTK